jgi:competence protein ComEA
MLYSLFVKLAMLGLTLGVVLWIGWTVPHSRYVEAERSSELGTLQDHPLRSSGPLAVSEAAFSLAQRQDASRTTRPVAEKLDLNRATEQDFEALPGIGPLLAERIVEYRQARGAFRDVEQLRRVKGIGKKKFDRIRSLVGVTVPQVQTKEPRKAT